MKRMLPCHLHTYGSAGIPMGAHAHWERAEILDHQPQVTLVLGLLSLNIPITVPAPLSPAHHISQARPCASMHVGQLRKEQVLAHDSRAAWIIGLQGAHVEEFKLHV